MYSRIETRLNSHPVQILFEKGNHLRGKTHFRIYYVIIFYKIYIFNTKRVNRTFFLFGTILARTTKKVGIFEEKRDIFEN